MKHLFVLFLALFVSLSSVAGTEAVEFRGPDVQLYGHRIGHGGFTFRSSGGETAANGFCKAKGFESAILHGSKDVQNYCYYNEVVYFSSENEMEVTTWRWCSLLTHVVCK